MSLFEGYERRIDKINEVCKQYGIASIEDAKTICADKGINPYQIVEDLQPIAFENAKWASPLGAANAIKFFFFFFFVGGGWLLLLPRRPRVLRGC